MCFIAFGGGAFRRSVCFAVYLCNTVFITMLHPSVLYRLVELTCAESFVLLHISRSERYAAQSYEPG